MWDTWKNCNPGLQFFHVTHVREITLISCPPAVIPLYVFALYCKFDVEYMIMTDVYLQSVDFSA